MKVLYCNPVFFEYRLPFYEELNRLFGGDFHVMYSPVRFKICGKESFMHRVKDVLGENAHELTSDHVFDTNSRKFDYMPDIERGKRIPFTWGLLRAIGKVKPDVLITEGYFQWTPMVLLYGLLHHAPVYMGYERTPWTERNTGGLKLWQRKLFNPRFAGFLVNGSETRRYLESIGVPSGKIHVGGMNADASFLQERLLQYPKPSRQGEGLTYLFVGQIAERKGVKYLCEAWREHITRYPDDTLLLVGNGNQLDELKAKYSDASSIVFTGRVDYESIARYYAKADVFVNPTIEDNWSLVVPEAMACGLPVATSIYNGCYPELIKEGENGYVFDTFKQESIVDVLGKFHGKDLTAMGEVSRRLEEPFNAANSARRVYDAIVRNQ